ncbi:HAD-IA family hydrolase [Leeia oryzae]|uniref:HAD-IA family hydrolase n=1 Tax=Leeia oryzae TaxID=356662 RepID=UPI000378A5B8|nr:HAD-IA family hydrolase [Leeia oryzae]
MPADTHRPFDLVVFDWDGTLMDSTAAIVQALQLAFERMGLPVPEKKACQHVIGLGLIDAMAYLAPALAETDHKQIAVHYREAYFATSQTLVLYDGANALLDELEQQGYYLAVATGKSRRGLNEALEVSGLQNRFHATRCADESFSKPNPAMLFDVMDRVGVSSARTIMIGDTTHDLRMAEAAGTAALGLTHGAHDLAALQAVPHLAILDDLPAIQQWLKAYRPG